MTKEAQDLKYFRFRVKLIFNESAQGKFYVSIKIAIYKTLRRVDTT